MKISSVWITRHALDRWEERDGRMAHVPSIVHLVHEAFRAERCSKRQPLWSFWNGTGEQSKNEGTIRYAWTEDLRIVFICRIRERDRRRQAVVVTVLRAPVAAAA